MNAVVGTAFTVSVEITDPNLGDMVTVKALGLPPGLVLEQGRAPSGPTIATVRGMIDSRAPVGNHPVAWSATDDLHPAITRDRTACQETQRLRAGPRANSMSGIPGEG